MFDPPTCDLTASAISSPALGDGPSPSGSAGGPPLDLYGQVLVPASRSARRGNGRARPTPGTCGPSSTGSSASVALQRCLANRLRATTDCGGSMEYALIWKDRVTPSGRRICALRASGRRTSGSDFSGAPTPTVTSIIDKDDPTPRIRIRPGGSFAKRSKRGQVGSINWSQWALLRGFLPTPKAAGWWMGYPDAWHLCGATAMQSSRKSGRRS